MSCLFGVRVCCFHFEVVLFGCVCLVFWLRFVLLCYFDCLLYEVEYFNSSCGNLCSCLLF